MKHSYTLEYVAGSFNGTRAVYNSARVERGVHLQVGNRKAMRGEYARGGFVAVPMHGDRCNTISLGRTLAEALLRVDGYERRTVGADVTDDKGKVLQRGAVIVEHFGGLAHVHIVNRAEWMQSSVGVESIVGKLAKRKARNADRSHFSVAA